MPIRWYRPCDIICDGPARATRCNLKRRYAFVVGLYFTALASGQVDTGTITGMVRDSSGRALPKAQVAIRNEGTGQILKLEAHEDGLYASAPLRPGEYTLEVEATGFEKAAKRVR